MGFVDTIANIIPEVRGPTEKRLSLKVKLQWTGIILAAYFILGLVPLYGLSEAALSQFEFLSIILGASFGSLLTLGIGPIVTSSIVLQLLKGSGLLKLDTNSPEGRSKFQQIQKVLTLGFILVESFIFVYMGGLTAQVGISPMILVIQLIIGGILVLFMDETVQKWGIGSGISLFIAAGVSRTMVTQLINWLPATNALGDQYAIGALPRMVQSLAASDLATFYAALAGILATVVVFAIVVFAQGMKIEIPLSFGMVRGHGIRWPLNFFYTSNIPVILTAALLANVQLFARLLANTGGFGWLGTFDANGAATGGLVTWLTGRNLLEHVIQGGFQPIFLLHALVYILFLAGGSLLFSLFWVQTAGLDARSQAKNMMASGLTIPGFRKDPRVLELMLKKYISPLTVMGGISVGILAAVADLTGAFGTGTGILLTVMIIYRFYEDLAKQHMMDLNPSMRKFIAK
ncbi:MAG: preprotein translocase subunit SecY [Candidatus Woesearchaeota archaeon]|nr:MAG: preprotein translocase subunit SecY [Candidatus Woesearchaeota archaeon]